MKKIFLIISVMVMGIFLSLGCMTKQVWSDRTIYPNYGQSYKERIVSFYMNSDEGKLVFIGEKYHYIFDENTKSFIDFLQDGKRLKLSQENLNISAHVNQNNIEKTSVSIHVEFDKSKVDATQISLLKTHFFRSNVNTNYYRSYTIKGIRYKTNNKINQQVFQLEQPIELDILAPEEINRSTLKKIAMTPLTLSVDALGGVILVGAGIVMSPIWLYQAITK